MVVGGERQWAVTRGWQAPLGRTEREFCGRGRGRLCASVKKAKEEAECQKKEATKAITAA